MAKGCGFIILCVIGLLGISMLYYALGPYFDTETQISSEDEEFTEAFVYNVFTKEDPTDSAYYKVIPVIEYSYKDSIYTDTAYSLARTTEKDGFIDEMATYYYQEGDLISVKVSGPDEYEETDAIPIEHLLQEIITEWQIGLIIVGSVFMIIFLRGLSKTFAYKEPPQSERF